LMKTYFAKQLFDGQKMHTNMHMSVNNGKISHIETSQKSQFTADAQLNGLVCAGFIDTQVNGGGGVLFNYEQSPTALSKMMQGHAKFGTTAMLPTLITDSPDKMFKAANAVADAIAESIPGIVGIHYEGPHLSQAKKGIHPSSHVRTVSDSDLATFTRPDIGKVMVTLAPENVPNDVIKDLVKQGVVVSLGHSGATIDQALAAIDAGATCSTHLFNAMSGLTAREPGLISAALSDARIFSGLIADLHHVHPQNCMLAYQCIGAERLMLVTDAMAHVGSDLQTLPWLDSSITKVGDKLILDDGSLAGSCLDMTSAVRNMLNLLQIRISTASRTNILADTLKMASQVPANLLGLDGYGELAVGKRADFVLLDNKIYTQACWISGKQISGEEPEA
jgi:N-acetylglucosamine-6-phosphate deacetylase